MYLEWESTVLFPQPLKRLLSISSRLIERSEINRVNVLAFSKDRKIAGGIKLDTSWDEDIAALLSNEHLRLLQFHDKRAAFISCSCRINIIDTQEQSTVVSAENQHPYSLS